MTSMTPTPLARTSSAAPALPVPPRRRSTVWAIGLALPLGAALATLVRPGTHPFLADVVCLSFLSWAAVTDLLRQVIPNTLTYPACLVSIAVVLLKQVASSPALDSLLGAPALLDSLLAFVLVGSVALVGLLLGAWGGGDAKIVTALAPLLGLQMTVGIVMVGMLLVAVLYAVNQLSRGAMLDRTQDLVAATVRRATGRAPRVKRVRGRTMPLAPGFLLGYPALWALEQCDLFGRVLS